MCVRERLVRLSQQRKEHCQVVVRFAVVWIGSDCLLELGCCLFAAILPQFIVSDAGSVPVQLALLGFVFVVIALVSDSAWVVVAGTARDWFARSPRRLELVGGAGGLMMIAVGIRLAFTGRKD